MGLVLITPVYTFFYQRNTQKYESYREVPITYSSYTMCNTYQITGVPPLILIWTGGKFKVTNSVVTQISKLRFLKKCYLYC